jgi:hypothetical protein
MAKIVLGNPITSEEQAPRVTLGTSMAEPPKEESEGFLQELGEVVISGGI